MNPITCLLEGNGSLAGRDRAGAFTATGSGALRYAAANGARINYFPNPGLGSNSTGMNAAGSATCTRTADTDFSSGYCYEIAATASTSDGANLFTLNRPSVTWSAATFTVSFDAKLTAGASDWQVFIANTDATGTKIGSNGTAVDFVPTATVGRVAVQVTMPTQAGSHGALIAIRRKTAATGTIRASDFTIEVGTTSGVAITNPVWLDPITGALGTAHASPSVSRATFWIEEATTNTVPDPSFEAATITTNWTAAGSATISKVTTHAYLGSNGGKVSCTASTNDGIDQLSTSGAAASSGQTWTVSGRIRAFASGDVGKTVKPQIVERTSADAAVATNLGSAITLTDAWQAFSYTVTLAGGGTVAKATCGFRAGAATAVDFVLDCVQLEQKSYATSYCDGTLGTGYSWSGTAHASTSTRAAAYMTLASTGHISSLAGLVFARVNTVDQEQTAAYFGVGNFGTTDWLSGQFGFSGTNLLSMASKVAANATRSIGVAGAFPNNTWKNVTGGWDASTIYASVEGTGSNTASRVDTPSGSVGGGNINIGNVSGFLYNGYLGPVVIYDRPLTAAERAKVNAAIDSNGAASLWTVLGSNAYRNFQLRPISQ